MKKGSTDYQFQQSKSIEPNTHNQNAEYDVKKRIQKSGDRNCFIEAYKTLQQDLIDRNKELVQSLIFKQSQSRKNLAEYLKRALNKTGKVVHIYCHANKEWKELLTQIMKEHWGRLFEERKSRYNEIARQHTQRLQHSKEYKIKEFNGQDMLKLDILSLFLERNSQYRSACHHIIPNFVLPITIASTFDLEKQDCLLHLKQFEAVQSQLNYQFREKYEEIITIFYIVEVKYKAANYEQRDGKINYNNVKRMELLPEHLNAKGKTVSDYRIRFNFCEVAYYPKIDPRTKPITLATVCRKSELIYNLQKIAKLPSLIEMKQKLIRLAEVKIASVCILNEWLQIIRNPQHQLYLTTFSKELKLKNELQKCQWSFFKSDHCLFILSKISGESFSTSEVYSESRSNYIFLNLMKIAIKRSQLFSKVLQTQMKMETKKSIFIKKFKLNYNDIVCCGKQAEGTSENEQANLNVTLLLGVLCQSILFYSVTKGQLSKDQQCFIIKDFVIRFSNIQPLTNLVVFDEGSVGAKFYTLTRYIELAYKAKLFITNDQGYFSYHSSTSAYLLFCLRAMRTSICKENFQSVVQKMIMRLYGVLSRRVYSMRGQVKA